MFTGYVKFAGTEVANLERLLTYVRNGVVDPDLVVETPAYCPDGIRAAVGDPEYRTPILDSPPWYDLTDGDSGDFAGFLVTGVTGVWGSTKTTQLTERASDGAIIGATRAASKTLAFTAIGIARSQCGIDAGIAWLSSALHPPCSDPAALGDGGALEFFTCCPDATCPIPDPLATTSDVASTIELSVRYPYTPVLTGTVDYAVAGGAGGSVPDYIHGGGATPGGTVVYTAGGAILPGAEPDPYGHANEEGFYAGEVTDCGTERLVWDLTIASPGTGIDPCRVAFAAVSPDGGTFLWVEPWQTLTAGHHVLTWDPVEVFDVWRPALIVQPYASVTVNSLTATERPLLTIDACVAPLRRSFQQVVTVDGPKVTATWGSDGEVTLAQVEWTWVAADPYVYADPISLATGIHSDGTGPTSTHAGVTVGTPADVTAVDTACPLPTPSDDTCASDPTCTGLPLPPTAPVIPNPCLTVPVRYSRRGVEIDPDITPASSAALTFTVTNVDATAVHSIRFRVYPDPDPDFGVADECAFSYEFTIDYLAAGQTMVIDGAAGRSTVTCADGSVVDADVALSGAYGGPFTFPTIGCGDRVFIAIDSSYDALIDTDSPGLVTVDIAMTRREG